MAKIFDNSILTLSVNLSARLGTGVQAYREALSRGNFERVDHIAQSRHRMLFLGGYVSKPTDLRPWGKIIDPSYPQPPSNEQLRDTAILLLEASQAITYSQTGPDTLTEQQQSYIVKVIEILSWELNDFGTSADIFHSARGTVADMLPTRAGVCR